MGAEPAVVRFHQVEWIVAETFNIFFFIATTWIGISLIAHGIRTGKWQKGHGSNMVNAGGLYTAAVVPFFLYYIRLISDQFAFNVGYLDSTSQPCEIAMDASILGYSITIISIYIFLWLRQRSLYQHPEMIGLDKQWLQIINWATLVVILVGMTATGVAFTLPQNYDRSLRGCVSKPKDQFTTWPLYMCSGMSLLGQGLLLFLFLYPLQSHVHGSSSKRILAILKRSSVFAGLSVASDVITMLIFVFALPESTLRQVSSTVYDVNLSVNLLSVLLSFDDWQSILTWACRGMGSGRAQQNVSSHSRNSATAETSLAKRDMDV